MKKQKTPNLVILGILTLITILLWIGLAAYRSFTTEPSVKVPSEILEPLSPALDLETLGKVENRLFFLEQDLAKIILTTTPEPSPTPSPEPTQLPEEQEEATESATSETNEATESGDITQ
jgi:hypothetical protein